VILPRISLNTTHPIAVAHHQPLTKVLTVDRLTPRQMLMLFEIINAEGERQNDEAILNGISASSGFDGYSLTLWDSHVTATLQFHNTIHCDFDSQTHLDEFLHKISVIEKNHAARTSD
jgi:Protein of unknown function (DUF3081)